ncbi:MAG: CPBP family intramembrane glutamic endopeptidase [Bacteroidia bacterium]
MNKKKIGLFLLFAFGISWLSAGIMYLCGVKYGTFLSTAVIAIFYMGAPATAAIIVQKAIYKQPIKELGFVFKEYKVKGFLWVPVFYFLLCFLWLGLVFIFGNILHLYGFGSITFESENVLANLNEITKVAGEQHELTRLPLQPTILFFTLLASSFIAGILINTLFTLGEELGWRGFLYNETRHSGFWKSNLFIGIIWGLWHAPIILQGHNYPDHRISGVFMMVLFCVSLAYIMAYLRAKTKSVLAPAFMHAVINAMAGNLVLFSMNGNDIIGSAAGLSGIIACFIILLLIVLFDKKTIRNYAN